MVLYEYLGLSIIADNEKNNTKTNDNNPSKTPNPETPTVIRCIVQYIRIVTPNI